LSTRLGAGEVGSIPALSAGGSGFPGPHPAGRINQRKEVVIHMSREEIFKLTSLASCAG
jgi:hypothetical protein